MRLDRDLGAKSTVTFILPITGRGFSAIPSEITDAPKRGENGKE
jgi:hypothetical protein